MPRAAVRDLFRPLALVVALALCAAAPAVAQRFLPDDPIAVDPDRLDMPPPEPYAPSDIWDFVENTFWRPGDDDGESMNINTLGEVPRSSWYTPRHYYDPMTPEELERGPDRYVGDARTAGPSREGPWEVVSVKDEGKSIGMQIVDARGDRYLLKFDSPNYPELSTGAEGVVTKIFYALGYHVPENYPVRFDPERLVPSEEEDFTQEQIDTILAKAKPYEDGSYRALASLFLEGDPIGPFLYYGTRPDDANDVIPHESRRELRGMRVFAAWVNHDDSRSINSLDTVVEEEGDTFVRHHVIDLGSTLGGGPLGPKRDWAGYEYAVDPGPMMARALSLGFLGSSWRDIDYPNDHLPAVGRFDAEHFDPVDWRGQYPNPAFYRMKAGDAFWAAKQVMAFTDEDIRAFVRAGRYTNPEAADYIAETLMARRDKIGDAFLDHGGGLDRFRVENGRLRFTDLLAQHGLAEEGMVRNVTVQRFDNQTGAAGELLLAGAYRDTSTPLPVDAEAPFLLVEIRTPDLGRTRVFLRRDGSTYEVVGVERE